MFKFWSEEEKSILVENYGKMKKIDLLKFLPGRTLFGIKGQAKKLNLKADREKTHCRIKKCNELFFDNPNIINSYWAGFIAADGCVAKNKNVFSVSQIDLKVIEKFRDAINFNGKINVKRKGKSKLNKKDLYTIDITSKKIVSDLRNNFNIVPCKSLVLEPPKNLNFECSLAFIIGYIDGDGCIIWNGKNESRFLSLRIVGTPSVLKWMNEKLGQNVKTYSSNKSEFTHVLHMTHRKAKKAFFLLNSVKELDGVKFERKWNKTYEYCGSFL